MPLWEKIKSQYGSASNALSNLTISGIEEDGATEQETVIHKALVNYYVSKEEQLPAWLGVEVVPQYRHSMENRPTYEQRSSFEPRQGIRRTNTQGSALQDIYARHQRPSTEITSGQPANPRDRFLPPSRSQSFNNVGNASRGGSERNDKFRDKLKSSSRAQW